MAASTAIANSTTALSSCNSRHHLFPKFASISLLHGLPEFRPPPLGLAHHYTANGSSLPIIRAQSSPGMQTEIVFTLPLAVGYTPEANFYKVEAILRPWRIQQVSSALLKMGIRGITVSDVRGFGAQGGSAERQAGSEFSEDNFVVKVKMEIVVSKDQVEEVIAKIIDQARTGEIGDGKIFVSPVADIIRVRTGERGEKAERMTGGRYDMFSVGSSTT
ncbi:nitrogen regulatory protein P-II homolog isoform X1 [Salvia hispanica]|uniref:nitrogen regulatory protein P-II homolog isoform X1 n=1 Tax=Salvia hispanica TaxID=49212 RepID=UPI0020091B85|nr:nitrogen regulatory protein P-II homolog isoform X1 [Salvia hispanica]